MGYHSAASSYFIMHPIRHQPMSQGEYIRWRGGRHVQSSPGYEDQVSDQPRGRHARPEEAQSPLEFTWFSQVTHDLARQQLYWLGLFVAPFFCLVSKCFAARVLWRVTWRLWLYWSSVKLLRSSAREDNHRWLNGGKATKTAERRGKTAKYRGKTKSVIFTFEPVRFSLGK